MRLIMDNARAAEVLCIATTYNGCGRATSDELKEAISIAYNALRNSTLRPKGEWKPCFGDWRKQIEGDECSACGFQHYGTSIGHYNFCPNCGADMRGYA